MKFFSNDAAKNNDPEVAEEHGREHVASEPVAVPQQRAGSPWSDAPGAADAEPADRRERPDGIDEPAAYGREGSVATTVDAPAGGYRGAHTDADVVEPQAVPLHAASADTDRLDRPAIKDDGTFDGPQAVDPATDRPIDAGRTAQDAAIKDDGTFDSPQAVDPATDRPIDAGRTAQDAAIKDDGTFDSPQVVDPAGDGTPVAAVPASAGSTSAASPAAASPSAAPASAVERFFTDGDTFADRFRDVQLRFVDSPKEATAEAAALVDEAVDKLTDALRQQRASLTGGSDDTEKLRVELRGYRELLNRLLAL